MPSLSLSSTKPTYQQLFTNIFQPKCLYCHSTGSYPNFSTYATLMGAGAVSPNNPFASPIYVSAANGKMPKGGPALTAAEVQAIYLWIENGALIDDGNPPPLSPPNAPSTLTASGASSSTIILGWLLPTQTTTTVKIFRAASSAGPYSEVASIPGGSTSHVDSGLAAGTTYYYKVLVQNAQGVSPYSPIAFATTNSAAVSIPVAPSSLSATTAANTQINLSWIDNSSDESGFKVERATNSSGPYSLVASLTSNVTSYSNTGLTSATTYYYRVSATNSAGSSAPTAASATTSAAPIGASYTWIKANVIPTCNTCHGTGVQTAGYNFDSFAGVRAAVTPGNLSASLFYTEINSGSMPYGGPALSAAMINNVKLWIEAGAPNN